MHKANIKNQVRRLFDVILDNAVWYNPDPQLLIHNFIYVQIGFRNLCSHNAHISNFSQSMYVKRGLDKE